MKRCPNCNQIFSDDNLFCLNDGTSLLDISNTGQTPTIFLTPESSPTQFVPRPTANIPNSSGGIPGWLYAVLGAMAAIIVALGVAFFVTRTPTEKETAKTDQSTKQGETASNLNQSNIENKQVAPTPNNANVAFSTPRRTVSINPNLNPSGRWTGDWNSAKSSFTAELNLTDNGAGKFSGQIFWTLRSSINPKKIYKAGATATEYVQGTFNPATRTLVLSGYRKDDPNDIVVLDKYNLVLAENNQTLGGGSKSNGRFNLKR